MATNDDPFIIESGDGRRNASESLHTSDWAELVHATLQSAGQTSPKINPEILTQLEIALSAMAEPSPESTERPVGASADRSASLHPSLDTPRQED